MGELLLNWLNDEIQLSRRVTNFEQDFHNGFLFGQLLAKYSQQLNFHEFIDKDDKASRVNNFSLLLETLTALRVTYDANVAFKIVNRQLGVAKKLLYELKTQLEKTSDNAFSRSTKLGKTLTPLKKIQISREKFDQVQRQHFVKQLNELHPAQKEIVEHKLLKKYSDFHLLANRKVMQDEEKERQAQLLLRTRFYEQERDNLKKSEEFRKQWQTENREKWANNMTLRQIQISKDNQFRQKELEQKTKAKINSEANALRSLQSDIADFQRRNLRSRKADSDSQGESEPLAGVSAVKQQTKVIDARPAQGREQRRFAGGESEKKKHQREKRRRKMIVEQAKKYQLIEITRRQRCVLATIEQTSKQEKEIQYEIWRAWQNKTIIIEDQALQAEKIREKEETRQINARFKREELLKTYREEHRQEVNNALQGLTQLARVHQARMRKTVYAECERMVTQLLDITEKMYLSAQERNSPHLDPAEMQAEFVKFVTGTPDADEGSLSVQHYVEGSHEWNIPVVRPEEDVSANPKEDNALPNETVNNYYLGNILRTIFEKQYQRPSEDEEKAPERLVIALLGLQFGRKHQLAATMAEKHQFEVVEVERLVQRKLNDWLQFQKQGVECSKETSEVAKQCLAGQPLEERLVVGLVAEAIKGSKRAVLLDFPNTYEQAIELCRLISGVQPHDLLQQDRLAKRIQEFSRLARPNEARIVARQVRGCGLDFVWWIDLSPTNCFDRMLGRRWIGNDIVSIYDDSDPDLLKEGEKSSALAMRSQFKLANKEKLESWFSLFGSPTSEGSKNCWEAIDGNVEKDVLLSTIVEKAEQAVHLKEEEVLAAVQAQEQRKKDKELQQKQKKEREALKQRCSKANPQVLKQELGTALGKAELDKTFIQQVADVWNRIESTSLSSFRRVFQSFTGQQKARRAYLAQVKRNFIALLTREDHKFHLIKDFQRGYNEFLGANEDMLPLDHTKEELHQRVEDLENDLLGLVEEKREDAISERSSIMGSGWLQAQVDLIYECLSLLVQAQLNRFAVSQKIIVDFYAKRFMCNTKQFEPLNPELNQEILASLEGWKDGQCPRLDKLVAQALRILNREEEVIEDKNKKGGKAPPKKDEKKAAKKGGKEEVEEVRESTQEDLELKAAVNTEKAILRQRLNRIRTLGQRALSETSSSATKLYADLEDLYVYAHKVEQKAVSGLCRIFRRAIQEEQKIEFQVQIKHVEVLQTEHVRNFEKAKPIIQPAREEASDEHFTLSNLQQVFRFVGNEAQGTRISTRRLTVLLTRLITSQHLSKLTPKSWKALTPSKVEAFVQLLDRNNAGYVSLTELFMFLTICGYSIPTQTEIEQYTLQLSNYSSLKQANMQKFLSTRSWFDQQLITRQNTRVFDRNCEVKRALFGIFRNQEGTVQINPYLSAINLQDIGREIKRGEETYFDVAFD